MWLYRLFLSIGESFYYSVIYDNRYKFILEGLFHTVLIAALAVIIGVVIGVVIALIRNYYETSGKLRFLNKLSTWYVDIIRGTPVVLQLMIIYYVIFKSVDISTVVVGVLAFGINSGAYVSEIIRSGIRSVPIGQSEAGYSLGLEYYQVMGYIVLPQAIRNILPALGNEFITLLKETSVGAYVGIIELTKASDIIASRTYDYFFPLIIIAIIYLIMTLGLTRVVQSMERRLNHVRS
jgi:His/Glu/Gln/Arg/opine family amino acid ABC transporter permease subunit